MAEQAADGVSYDWWTEFAAGASGVGATFSPVIIGFAATLRNLDSFLDADMEALPIAAALAAYLAVWMFLTGGIIDRYARQRSTRASGFFAACGVFFWRFLRLALLAGAAYWILFTYVHPWLLDDLHTRLTRDLSAERPAVFWRAILSLAFVALLVAVNLVIDYTKIRTVVEDRRSVAGALLAALRFVVRRKGPAAELYAINVVAFLALLVAWALLAPGAGDAGVSMWIGLAVSQAYILGRLLLKLQFLASQTAFFQASLAHAAYVARPEPVWPESASAETVTGRP